MKNKRVTIQKKELGQLIFWADWGIGKARGGSSGQKTSDTIVKLSQRHLTYKYKPVLGKYLA